MLGDSELGPRPDCALASQAQPTILERLAIMRWERQPQPLHARRRAEVLLSRCGVTGSDFHRTGAARAQAAAVDHVSATVVRRMTRFEQECAERRAAGIDARTKSAAGEADRRGRRHEPVLKSRKFGLLFLYGFIYHLWS